MNSGQSMAIYLYIKCNAMYIKLIKKVLSYVIIVTDIHQYNKTAPDFCWCCNVVFATDEKFILTNESFSLVGKGMSAKIGGIGHY